MTPEALAAIEAAAAAVGAWVEPKGAAAAVHFRGLDDPLEAAAAAEPALAAVAAAHGLELLGGKRILELMPAGAGRKGGAVERLARERTSTRSCSPGTTSATSTRSRRSAGCARRGPGRAGSSRAVRRRRLRSPPPPTSRWTVRTGSRAHSARSPTSWRRGSVRDERRLLSPRPAGGPRRSRGAAPRATWPGCARAPSAGGPGARRRRSSSGIERASWIASAVSERSNGLIASACARGGRTRPRSAKGSARRRACSRRDPPSPRGSSRRAPGSRASRRSGRTPRPRT